MHLITHTYPDKDSHLHTFGSTAVVSWLVQTHTHIHAHVWDATEEALWLEGHQFNPGAKWENGGRENEWVTLSLTAATKVPLS